MIKLLPIRYMQNRHFLTAQQNHELYLAHPLVSYAPYYSFPYLSLFLEQLLNRELLLNACQDAFVKCVHVFE